MFGAGCVSRFWSSSVVMFCSKIGVFNLLSFSSFSNEMGWWVLQILRIVFCSIERLMFCLVCEFLLGVKLVLNMLVRLKIGEIFLDSIYCRRPRDCASNS